MLMISEKVLGMSAPKSKRSPSSINRTPPAISVTGAQEQKLSERIYLP
jgi:hypothetical protein